MSRFLRVSVTLLVTLCALSIPLIVAAESGGSRIIILPLRGPGGAVARNEIAKTIEPDVSYVAKIGMAGAKRPARTARMHKATAILGGRVRCPGRACVVDVLIYRPSGRLWTKGTRRTTRARIAQTAADLSVDLLGEIGLLEAGEEPASEEDIDSYEESEYEEVGGRGDESEEGSDYDEFDMENFEEDEEGERSSSGRASEHDFDALEVFFAADMTVARNLCVDLDPELQNDDTCNLRDPATDDRTYRGYYPGLGFRLALFPGAFVDRRRWWANIGLWAEYGHSVALTSQREYETNPPEDDPTNYHRITIDIPTVQQDFRLGLVYRLALRSGDPTAVQLRFMVGFGFYYFQLDDTAYPVDSEVRLRYRDSNPYLPSFEYASIDLGLQLRIPVRGFIFPYMNFFYRGGLGTGQASRIYGDASSTNGLDWELGVAISFAYGFRLFVATDLIWYKTVFAGSQAFEDDEEQQIWGGDDTLGDFASDLIFRIRLGFGWSY